MSDNFEWANQPINYELAPHQFREETEEDRLKARDEYYSLPIGGEYNQEIAQKMYTWNDIDRGAQKFRGLPDIGSATDDAMAEGYFSGWLQRNANSVRYVGRNINSLYDAGLYEDSLLELDPVTKEHLDHAISLSGWNAVDQVTGEMWGTDITDLLNQDPVEGWTPEDALVVFESRDPSRFKDLLNFFGSREEIEEIIKYAKNPIDFFYRLSNARHLRQISQSMAYYDQTASGLDKTGNFLKTLFVNGIINDPDLVASTGISVGLLAVPGGGLFAAGKILASTAKAGSRLSKIRRIALSMSKGLFTAQRYLPETIGPTLLQKYLWKEGYKTAGFIGRSLRNIPGNILEGTITGFMAEVSNQDRRVFLRFQDKFDWSVVGRGTREEALLSIAINPIMGRVYQVGGLTALGTGYLAAEAPRWTGISYFRNRKNVEKYTAMADMFKSHIRELSNFRDPGFASRYIHYWNLMEDVGVLLDKHLTPGEASKLFGKGLTLEDGNNISVVQLDFLMQELGIPIQERIPLLKLSLERIEQAGIPEGGRNVEDLMTAVAEDLASNLPHVREVMNTPEGQQVVQKVINQLFYLQNLSKWASRNNMTLEEAHTKLLEEENFFEVLTNEEEAAMVEASFTDEEKKRLKEMSKKERDNAKWERAKELRDKAEEEDKAHVEEIKKDNRQAAEDLGDAVEKAAEANSEDEAPNIDTPPKDESTADSVKSSDERSKKGRDYTKAYEKTHRKTKDKLEKAKEEEEKAKEAHESKNTEETREAVKEAEANTKALSDLEEKQAESLENLQAAVAKAEELSALLDSKVSHLTKGERAEFKRIFDRIKVLEKESRKYILQFRKELRTAILDAKEGLSLLDKIKRIKGPKSKKKKSDLTEKEKKKLSIWLASLRNLAERSGNKKLSKALDRIENSETLSDLDLGKAISSVELHSKLRQEKIFQKEVDGVNPYKEYKQRADEIKELTAEVEVLNTKVNARTARIRRRRFDRMSSARQIAVNQKRIRRSTKNSLDAFEAQAEKRGKDGTFTRQELFEYNDSTEVGGYISRLSRDFEDYAGIKKKLQGKKLSEYLKHEFTVSEARQLLVNSNREVNTALITQKPGVMLSDAFSHKGRPGEDITTRDQEYLSDPDRDSSERLELSTPGIDLSSRAFYLEGQEVKGFVTLQEGAISTIVAFETADISTAIHELAHIARRYLLSENDSRILENWLGVESSWTEEHEETFARAFERYMLEGESPAGGLLQELFNKIKNWLSSIYKSISNSEIDIDISPEVKEVFDRLVQRGTIASEYDLTSNMAQEIKKATQLTDGEVIAILSLMDAMGFEKGTIRWELGTREHMEKLQKTTRESSRIEAELMFQRETFTTKDGKTLVRNLDGDEIDISDTGVTLLVDEDGFPVKTYAGLHAKTTNKEVLSRDPELQNLRAEYDKVTTTIEEAETRIKDIENRDVFHKARKFGVYEGVVKENEGRIQKKQKLYDEAREKAAKDPTPENEKEVEQTLEDLNFWKEENKRILEEVGSPVGTLTEEDKQLLIDSEEEIDRIQDKIHDLYQEEKKIGLEIQRALRVKEEKTIDLKEYETREVWVSDKKKIGETYVERDHRGLTQPLYVLSSGVIRIKFDPKDLINWSNMGIYISGKKKNTENMPQGFIDYLRKHKDTLVTEEGGERLFTRRTQEIYSLYNSWYKTLSSEEKKTTPNTIVFENIIDASTSVSIEESSTYLGSTYLLMEGTEQLVASNTGIPLLLQRTRRNTDPIPPNLPAPFPSQKPTRWTPQLEAYTKDSVVKSAWVFHGTRADPAQLSDVFNTKQHLGLHLTSNPYTAGAPRFVGDGKDIDSTFGRIYPLYMHLTNPLRLRDIDSWRSTSNIGLVVEDSLGSDVITQEEYNRRVLNKMMSLESELSRKRRDGIIDEDIYFEERGKVLSIARQDVLKEHGYDGIIYLNRGEIYDRNTGNVVEDLFEKMYTLQLLDTQRQGEDYSSLRDHRFLRSITDEEFLSVFPEAEDSYIVFDPEQVKSALANNGFYSLEEESIAFQTRAPRGESLVVEATAWASWVEGLRSIQTNTKKLHEIGGTLYTESIRIWGTMPKFFRDQGRGPHVIFKKALLDQDIHNPMQSDVDNFINEERGLYDLESVIQIAEQEHARSVGRLRGWQKVSRQNLLEELTNEIVGTGEKPGDVANYYVSIEFIKRVEEAFRPIYIDLYSKRGFISHLDSVTGEPIFLRKANKHDAAVFETLVKRAIKNRLEEKARWKSGNPNPLIFDRIFQTLGITPDDADYTLEAAVNIIVDNIEKMTPKDETLPWSIERLGNGEIDMAPASELGAGLVDLLLGVPLATQRGVRSIVSERGEARTEEVVEGGESLQTVQARSGESNRAASIPLYHLAEIVNQYRFWQKVKYLLSVKEFTPEQKREVEKWISEVNTDGTPDPLGFRSGFLSTPHFMGGSLDAVVPSAETIKKWTLDFTYKMSNLAASTIYDQISVSQNNPLRFRGDLNNFSEDFSHGDDIILPFHWWGEVLAYEQMSPRLEGLSTALLKHEAARYLEWRTKNPDLSLSELFSKQTHSDRTGSGIWEMKALSLAADPQAIDNLIDLLKDTHGTKTIAKEIEKHGLFETILKHRGFTTKELSDHYINLALQVAQLIRENPNSSRIQKLGPLLEAFEALGEVTTVEEMQKLAESNEIVKALRNIFKIPAMRHIYSGSLNNFEKEFIRAKKGKAREAVEELGRLLNVDFYSGDHAELTALGDILYNVGVNNMSIALQEASLGKGWKRGQVSMTERGTGVSDSMKIAVMKYLSINQSTDGNATLVKQMAENWEKVIRVKALEDAKSTEDSLVKGTRKDAETGVETSVEFRPSTEAKKDTPGKTNSIIRASEALKLYERNLHKAAIIDFGEQMDFEEALERTKNRYTNWPAVEAYLKERRDKVLTPEELAEVKELAGLPIPQSEMGVFKGLNMLGSSAHRLNQERNQIMADALGIAGFDAANQLTPFADNNLFFPVGFSTMSDRGYQGLLNLATLTGSALERVAVKPLMMRDPDSGKLVQFPYKSLEEYMIAKKTEVEDRGETWTKKHTREAWKFFFDNVENAEESFGAYDLMDNPLHGLTEEEAVKKIEHMITLQQFLWWASYQKLPSNVFPDYVIEDSDTELLSQLQKEWMDHSEMMYRELPLEIQIETEEASLEELRLKGKSNLLRSEEASKRVGYPIQLYHRNETDSTRLVETGRKKGFMSTEPLYQTLPFFDKGILSLQRKALEAKIESLTGELQNLHTVVAPRVDEANTRGWASPWSEEVLSVPTRTKVDYLQLFPKNEEGILAGEISRDLDNWAERRGILNEVYENPQFYPYYYLVREIEKIHEKFVKYAQSGLNEEELTIRRSEWLTALHSLDEVSRNVLNYEHSSLTLEDKANILALVRPIHDKATWREILTSTVTEDNESGLLLSPTNIHQELKSPLMPVEGVPIFRNEREAAEWDELVGKAGWEDMVKSLTIDSGIIQAHDFNRFVIAIMYQDYIHQVLKDYTRPDGTKPYKDVADTVLKNPIEWEKVVLREDRINIIEEAKLLARGRAGTSIELSISVAEHIENAGSPDEARLIKLMVERAVSPQTKRGRDKEEISFNGRHAAGELGFGFLVRSPRKYKLIGNKFKIALTPEAALKIFAITDNIKPLHELQQAYLSNKIFGVKFDTDGTPMRAKPLQDQIRDAIGFTTRSQNAEATKISNALEMIVRQSQNDKSKGPRKLLHKGVTLDNFGLDLVDLSGYKSGEYGAPEGMTTVWREAMLSPIAEALHEIDSSNLATVNFNLATELQSLLNRTRSSIGNDLNDALGTSIALSALILNGSRRVPTDSMIIPFLNPEVYNINRVEGSDKISIDPLIQKAEDLYKKLVIFQDEDSFIQTLPLYHAARTFAFETGLSVVSEDNSNLEDDFITWLKGRGLWDFAVGEDLEIQSSGYTAMTKKLLKKLGFTEEQVEALPEFTDYDNWIKDTDKVISIDIETNLPYREEARQIIAVDVYDHSTKTHITTLNKTNITPEEARAILDQLEELQNQGYKLVTFNGTAFDLNHLGKVAGNQKLAGRIAVRSIDLMTDLMSINDSKTPTGLSLDAVSKALGITGKTAKGLFAVLYWKRMRNETVETSDFSVVNKVDGESLSQEDRQDIVTEINKLSPKKAKELLLEYVQDDTLKNQQVFAKLINNEGGTLEVGTHTLKIRKPRPVWREGLDLHRWNTLLRNRFTSWGVFSQDNITEVSLSEPTNLTQSIYTRHLDNYKPGLSAEEKKRQLALLSLRAAVDHQEKFEVLRYESREPSIFSEGVELDTLQRTYTSNVSRTLDSSLTFADSQSDAIRPHLRRVIQTFGDLEKEGILNGKSARLLRQLVLNAHALNPLIVRDLRFDFERNVFSAGKTEGGGYYIRFGDKLKKLGKDPLDVVQIFAHELSHIARIKFIRNNSGEWKAFERLLNNQGKGLIKKLVRAWHGNRWDSLAQDEYRSYIQNGPEEFIAALGQYFLMKDLLPTIKDMTSKEAEALQAAVGIVGRIMSFVRETFQQLGHVWSRFFQTNEEVNVLMHRLFGLDITKPEYVRTNDVENPGPVEYYYMNRFADDDWQGKGGDRNSVEEVDSYFEGLANTRELLERSSDEGTITPDQIEELHGLTVKTNRKLESGLTIYDYYRHLPTLYDKAGEVFELGGNIVRVLNIEQILESESSTVSMTQLDKLVAYQHGLNRMRWVFGNQVLDNAGETAMKIAQGLKKISNMVGMGKGQSADENSIRNGILSGLVGHTGAEFTYGASHIIPVWLTTLIDERITNMRGHYDNIEGLPSLQRSLESLTNTENLILRLHSVIQNEILSPILSKIFGSGVSTKETKAILKDLNSSFALLVEIPEKFLTREQQIGMEIPEHMWMSKWLGLTDETISTILQLKDDKRKLLFDSLHEMSEVMRALIQSIGTMKASLGDWVGESSPRLGYLLSRDTHSEASSTSMFDAMNSQIHNNLLHDSERVSGLAFFAMNFLPRFDTVENLLEDFFGTRGIYGNNTNPSDLYILLVSQIAKHSNASFSPKERALNSTLSPEKQTYVDDFIQGFRARLEDGSNILLLKNTRDVVLSLMRNMNNGSIGWTDLNIGNKSKLQDRYRNYIAETSANPMNDMRINDRMQTLFVDTKNTDHFNHLNASIAFEVSEGMHALKEGRNLTTGHIYNVAQLHTRNLLNKALHGYYTPMDAWFVPAISEVITIPEIRDNLVLQPSTIIQKIKKGVADSTNERMILQHHLGLKGDIGHFLSLFEFAYQVGELHGLDGKKSSRSVVKAMGESVKQLRNKYNFIRGYQEDGESFGSFTDWAYTLAPAVTKIAFGGNLATASLVVEHMMNSLATLIGEGRLIDGFRTMLAPIFQGLSSEETKLVSADIADSVEGISQGFLPDYEGVANEAESLLGEDFMKAWAAQVLRFPKHIIRSTATARTITFRKSLYDMVVRKPEKFKALVEALQEKGIEKPGDLENIARDLNINWWRYGNTLTYLQRAGLLHPNRIADLKTLLEMGAVKDKFYLIGPMLSKMSSSLSGQSEEYANYTDILASLKHVESQYLHENMVLPNAFDVYTGGNRAVRTAEIFRRFPVLWAAQMMIRRSNRTPLVGYGVKLFTMLTLDMIYMMVLRLASGSSLEDLMKEMEQKGVAKFFLPYIGRLPIWGRYYGVIAAAASDILRTGKMHNGFIPGAALVNLISNTGTMLYAPFSDEKDITGRDLMNATRIIPYLGDTLLRLGIYAGAGNTILGQQTPYRGTGQYDYKHMGVPRHADYMSYEAISGEIQRSMGIKPDFPQYQNKFQNLPGMRSQWQRAEEESHIDPEKSNIDPEILPPRARTQTFDEVPSLDPIELIKKNEILEMPDELDN